MKEHLKSHRSSIWKAQEPTFQVLLIKLASQAGGQTLPEPEGMQNGTAPLQNARYMYTKLVAKRLVI